MHPDAMKKIFQDTDFVHRSGTPEELRVAEYLKARCEELGGRLAIPKDEEELKYISRLCNNEELTYAWLGASRQSDGSWITPDGEEVSFFRWSEGEPSMVDAGDGAAENYLLLWKEAEDEWYFNDSRDNPLEDYAWAYGGKIGFVCQMW